MNLQHLSFPSIDQLRTVVKHVGDRCTFHNVPRPTLTFHGTVKLHGTNASVVLLADGTYYAQSRTQVITPEADNAGFAAFAHSANVKAFLTVFALIAQAQDTAEGREPYSKHVAVYGEWCGVGIQSGVAVSKLPKMFVIFAVKLINASVEPAQTRWLMPWDVEAAFNSVENGPDSVKCIEKFQTWVAHINFADPLASQNELARITTEVEAQCPVGHALGVDGVGEGVVWTCVGGDAVQIRLDDLIFKVKGAKHSDSKVKTLAPVNIERLNSIKELAESVTTEHRLEKAVAFLRDTLHAENVYDVRNMGAFLKWVGQDVAKEEADTISGNNFDSKEVTKAVNELAKRWFLVKVNSDGLVI